MNSNTVCQFLSLSVALLGFSTLGFGSSFVGGFEDTVGSTSDYDYNDLVFSLSSNSLTLDSAQGQWFGMPSLDASPVMDVSGLGGTPFWNNGSRDGAELNIGWCVAGGGRCNTGAGLLPGASYIAGDPASPTGSANDVTFSSDDLVTLTVARRYAGFHNVIGWYAIGDPVTIHWLDAIGPIRGTFTFSSPTAFGLVANTQDGVGNQSFYSNTSDGGLQDNVSHFVFFGDTGSSLVSFARTDQPAGAPEPSTWILMLSVCVIGLLFRKRMAQFAVSSDRT